MTGALIDTQGREARLTIAGTPELRVFDSQQLQHAMQSLPDVQDGQSVTLSRGPKHYVTATRQEQLWSAVVRRGAWWTLSSFTAEMTSDYSARQVQKDRAMNSLRKRLISIIATPRAERQLSTEQVRTIFNEFFIGSRFTVPQSGAST